MTNRGITPQLKNENKMNLQLIERIKSLPCWSGEVEPEPIAGGITNYNFRVDDAGARFFVRTGVDIPVHGVMRFNELAATKAAEKVGLSPSMVYSEQGLMVCRFIDGHTFAEKDIRLADNLPRVLDLIRRCHNEMPRYFRGPALIFWVFHIIRNYISELEDQRSTYVDLLPDLTAKANLLEAAAGPNRIVFGHNDLLSANFIDDGTRLWLIDWDYAGYNSPLFDLANLASNNGLSPDQEHWLLESYFEAPVSEPLMISFNAMKSASLLRETMWSMVSEIHSTLDFDYAGYTVENMARFDAAFNNDKECFISHA